jgi:predicted helicase
MGFITNNGYLENPTFRGMRYSLLKSFDEIYILDLHGTARDAGKNLGDENIFDVRRIDFTGVQDRCPLELAECK